MKKTERTYCLHCKEEAAPGHCAALKREVERLREEQAATIGRLRGLVRDLANSLPLGTVRCRGDKCREGWCESCYGEEAAEEGFRKIQELSRRARKEVEVGVERE